MKQHTIHLMGIDCTGLTPEKIEILQSCATILGTERLFYHLRPIMVAHPETRILKISPVSEALSLIEEALNVSDVGVLVGGDPLFFGIGKTLSRRFSVENIQIYPAISSMQMAFARFKISWDDARFFSVHGRRMDNLILQIGNLIKVFLLTDATNSPAAIATSLLEGLGKPQADHYTVHVAENLGEQQERLTTGSLHDISHKEFSDLSVMIITRQIDGTFDPPPRFGLQEQEIAHSRGLITKNEVRATTLHSLRLPDSGVFWDIGAGSGSVSLEAARMFPLLRVFAIESKNERINNILANKNEFNALNIQVIHGSAPEILTGLPDPERIFVGGSGDRLQNILQESVKRLLPGGIIVVNGVIENTRRIAPELLYNLGLAVSLAIVNVRRCNFPENKCMDLNPITIITGRKSGSTYGMEQNE
jgi:precorrin-6B C5,15-methyltransferase / cobalt-precorrin-6B C5,C15-methyltransferase